ncbi:MAG: DUF465 domain-containing protein [Myxococcales bacterium]|nr:DUF465 domain-containing protein [Myxococcales bacterium]
MQESTNTLSGATLERLRGEHQRLETRLTELNSHPYLTPDEQIEVKHLKKLKLIKKEQIQRLASQITR